MSVAQSILAIVEEEMEKHGLTRLSKVVVVNGKLAGVVSEALEFSWTAVTMDTPHQDSVMEIKEEPLVLKCGECGREFEPEGTMYAPCPECEETLGHEVLSGKQMYIENMEAE